MRFLDLKIETLRQAPSNARTEGLAFLVRAGYLTREGELTMLGEHTVSRLRKLAEVDRDLLTHLGLAIIRTQAQESFFEIHAGNDAVLHCPSCHYTDRAETAQFKKNASPAEIGGSGPGFFDPTWLGYYSDTGAGKLL